VRAHGASWNVVPPKADEMTVGDRPAPPGVRSVRVGRTHTRVGP
jgi:hypothetical protein